MDRKDPQSAPLKRTERELPLDTQLLSEAIIELNISRKNVGIYPPGHLQITKSIDRAYQILEKVFEIRQEMTLGVAKDTLLVGQDYLDRKNPVYRDFALSLNQQGIAAITFIRGLQKEELLGFHRILTTKADELARSGGIARVMAAAAISHIVVKIIDYNAFHLTEEQEITVPQGQGGKSHGEGLWQDFVSHLATGTLARSGDGQGVSLKDADQIDPLELARLLNERKLDPGKTVQSYDRIITSYVRGAAEKQELTREQSATLRNLNNLVKNLNPELRKQFLSVAFQRTADASPIATEEVLGGLSDNMVVEMLQQANAEGREISPTLTGLLNKLTSVGGGAPITSIPQQPMALPENMQKLFDREQYENYVSPEYEATLRRLSEHQPLSGLAGIEGFPLDEYLGSLTDENLDIQIGRVTLAFIDEEIEDEDYGEFLKKIVAIIPQLLETENFGPLHDILETLKMHSKTKKSLGIRSMVEYALRTFDDPVFLIKVVDAFSICRKTRVRAATGFLLSLGPKVIPPLLDQYALDETPGGKRALFDLLCRFGHAAVKEALKRLNDPRPTFVRNLLMLIRWGWDESVAPQVVPLLKHKDLKVRHEALTVLLRFKHPAAVPALRAMLNSVDPDEASLAIKLAGQFRMSAVIDTLLSKLKKVILFETDYLINEEIILALSELGDRRAIPDLEKLAQASWTLSPRNLARMKAELFESLERYPRESITGLIRIGEQSSNERIKRACKKLVERPAVA